MRKKILWMVVSCLMVAALLLASCAPAAEPTVPAKPEPVKPTPAKPAEEEEEEEVAPAVGEPQYGGTINLAIPYEPASFDPADGHYYSEAFGTVFIYEKMRIGDWTRGPAGTNESPFTHFWHTWPMSPHLCESWERPDLQTCIWHVRPGVYFQDIPPVNKREMTADDVAYSILRLKASPKVAISYYGMVESVEVPDKYTVVVKLNRPDSLYQKTTGTGSVCLVFPKEMVEKYGDLEDWKSACGTGPWILKDYVSGSSLTFVKNPNYWHKDPLRPENSLPYADGINAMIVPDRSTRMAALRTGKADVLLDATWKDAEAFEKSNPELKRKAVDNATGVLGLDPRVDIPPFSDIRVRRALHMAIDNQAIVNDYLRGNGKVLNHPIMEMWGEQVYTPLEKCPESVREQFEYHPEKARQLLAEAGYPDGFKTQIIAFAEVADLMALVKAWWADVGVDADIVIKDSSTVVSMAISMPRQWEGVVCWRNGTSSPARVWGGMYLEGSTWNIPCIADPHINEQYEAIYAEPDEAKRNKLIKDLNIYALEKCYFIQGPSEFTYNYWQPWLNNFYGANWLDGWGRFRSAMYWWVDQDMKEEMTGSR